MTPPPSSDRPLRVAHLTATFPPYYAGTGNVCFQQTRALAERGHHVEVWTATYDGPPQDPEGVVVHRLQPVLRVGLAPFMPQLLRMPPFDVVHLHLPFIFGSELGLVRALGGRMPVVISFHNMLVAGGAKGALFQAYRATALRAVLHRAARLVVLALDHAHSVPELEREYRRRPHDFVSVPNGVDVATFAPGDGSAGRGRLGLPNDATVAVFCAQLDHAHRTKRLDLLIDALAELGRRDLWLLVVGGGDLQPELERQAERLGVADRVVFAGRRSHEEVPELLRAADFLVIPSVGTEALGLVQLEALATGLPVIASSLPGLRTVVEPGVDGYHVTPGDARSLTDALATMLEDGPDGRARMGTRGRQKVIDRYTWERSAETLEETYRAVLAERGA